MVWRVLENKGRQMIRRCYRGFAVAFVVGLIAFHIIRKLCG